MALWTTPPERRDGVWEAYRHTAQHHLPLWYGGGAKSLHQESGRWHQEKRDVAQYLALSANGAWAERCRYAAIRDDVRRVAETRKLWQLQVVERDIADLSTFDHYVACGLAPELAVGPHADVHELAYELRAAGYRGVLSPAAAFDRPDAVNLTLFGERVEWQHYGAMPAPDHNPRPDTYIAVILIADSGAPTQYAMHHTSYEGGHHRTFDEWCRARGHRPGG